MRSQLKHWKHYERQLITNDVIAKTTAKCGMSVVWRAKSRFWTVLFRELANVLLFTNEPTCTCSISMRVLSVVRGRICLSSTRALISPASAFCVSLFLATFIWKHARGYSYTCLHKTHNMLPTSLWRKRFKARNHDTCTETFYNEIPGNIRITSL